MSNVDYPVDFFSGGDQRWCEAKDFAMRHSTGDQAAITGRLEIRAPTFSDGSRRVLVSGSATNSMAAIKPTPRTSPTIGSAPKVSCMDFWKYSPTLAALPGMSSCSTMSSTALAAATPMG